MTIPNDEAALGRASVPAADAVLAMDGGGAGAPASCALLTPAIRARLRELAPGQVLEVRVSDATAQDDIAAWCRLTGNELLSLASDVTGHTSYYLRKKLS